MLPMNSGTDPPLNKWNEKEKEKKKEEKEEEEEKEKEDENVHNESQGDQEEQAALVKFIATLRDI